MKLRRCSYRVLISSAKWANGAGTNKQTSKNETKQFIYACVRAMYTYIKLASCRDVFSSRRYSPRKRISSSRLLVLCTQKDTNDLGHKSFICMYACIRTHARQSRFIVQCLMKRRHGCCSCRVVMGTKNCEWKKRFGPRGTVPWHEIV